METTFPRIFLHFFDLHFLQQKGIKHPHNLVVDECRLATRLAIALADVVLVPAASFAESPICQEIVSEYKGLFPLGILEIAGNANHLAHFREKKLTEYPQKSKQHSLYSRLDVELITPPFYRRKRSATEDIRDYWLAMLDRPNGMPKLSTIARFPITSKFEKAWEAVPALLEDKAFIVGHVQPHLGEVAEHPDVEHYLHTVINQGYFASYTRDLRAGIITDMVYLDAGYDIESWAPNIPYRRLIRALLRHGLYERFSKCSPGDLLTVRSDPAWAPLLAYAIQTKVEDGEDTLQGHHDRTAPSLPRASVNPMSSLRAFIVHGHDTARLLELKDFLQNRLGMTEPKVLFQEPSRGRTLIEKFEEVANEIDVAFVLMSPDDLAEHGNERHYQARQNVIFELGFFVGKFGRRSGRVILLYVSPLTIPSDLAGIVYIDVSAGISAKSESIRQELSSLTQIH